MRLRSAAFAISSVVAVVTFFASLAGTGAGGIGLGVAHSGTRVVSYDPLTDAGALAPNLRVTQRFRGNCTGGGVAGRSSYRCTTTSSRIVDPCFAARPSGPFYCPVDLVEPDMIEVTTSVRAPATSFAPRRRVWAVELANGQLCVMVNAAWGGLGPFSCARSVESTPGGVADCRVPRRGGPWWLDSCQTKLSSSAPFTDHRVKVVWR